MQWGKSKKKVNSRPKEKICKTKKCPKKAKDKELIKITENIEVPEDDLDDSFRVFCQNDHKDKLGFQEFHVKFSRDSYGHSKILREPVSPYQSHNIFMTPSCKERTGNSIFESQLATPKDQNVNAETEMSKLIPGKIWNTRLKNYQSSSDLKQRLTPRKSWGLELAQKPENFEKTDQLFQENNIHKSYTSRDHHKESETQLLRSTSMQIAPEKEEINLRKNIHAGSFKEPDQGCFEVTDLKITKNMKNKIHKRTMAAIKQATQGEQRRKQKEFKEFTLTPKTCGRKQGKKNSKSSEKFTNFEQNNPRKNKKVRRVSQENIKAERQINSIKSSKKSNRLGKKEKQSSRVSFGVAPQMNIRLNSKKNLDSNIPSANSHLNIMPHNKSGVKDHLNNLDISPEEFTITELENPRVDMVARSSSMALTSMEDNLASYPSESADDSHKKAEEVPSKKLSEKNCVLNSVRRKLNDYYNKKVTSRTTNES
ncbi:unnamed protein product [Moneuplotes crassus]|uniref:Uncharacterized protein n=1 Tax=Euplotes crassus TaxID=5936 RepID=A0AAD1U8T7_EUPCR|nr:unnamed protein product [Moneuplotes crassus]